MRNNEQTLKEAIEHTLQFYRLKSKLQEVQIIDNWKKIMGNIIAKRTEQLYIKDKKLYIRVSSAPLREELKYAREKIIDLLNREAGAGIIEDIVLI